MFLVDHQVQVVTSTYTDTLSILDMDGNVIKTLKDDRGIIIATPNDTFVNLTSMRALNTNTNDVIWDYVDQSLPSGPFLHRIRYFFVTVTSRELLAHWGGKRASSCGKPRMWWAISHTHLTSSGYMHCARMGHSWLLVRMQAVQGF